MTRTLCAASALIFAISLGFLSGNPASAEVIVNNVFSPFSTVYVAPPRPVYRAYSGYGDTWWINDPNHHSRCYRRWLPHAQVWNTQCVRMHYWPRERYWD